MIHYLLVAIRLSIVLIGALIAYKSFKKFRVNGHRIQFLVLSVGFALLTIGAVVEGILFELFHFSFLSAHIIEGILVMIGLVIVIIAIWINR